MCRFRACFMKIWTRNIKIPNSRFRKSAGKKLYARWTNEIIKNKYETSSLNKKFTTLDYHIFPTFITILLILLVVFAGMFTNEASCFALSFIIFCLFVRNAFIISSFEKPVFSIQFSSVKSEMLWNPKSPHICKLMTYWTNVR